MTVVFVCTGNTCRSPMAEGIFRTLAQKRGLQVNATSCGLSAFAGSPASEHAVTAAKTYGADLTAHRSRPCSAYLLEEGDLFVCMSQSHALALMPYVPAEKIRILGQGIPDPYGGDLETYQHCTKAIYDGLLTLIEKEDLT